MCDTFKPCFEKIWSNILLTIQLVAIAWNFIFCLLMSKIVVIFLSTKYVVYLNHGGKNDGVASFLFNTIRVGSESSAPKGIATLVGRLSYYNCDLIYDLDYTLTISEDAFLLKCFFQTDWTRS